MKRKDESGAHKILRHWLEDVPDDRLGHLIRDVSRMLTKSLQTRLVEHSVSFGHWAFLRILWVNNGLTQRELSDKAGVMESTTFSALKAMEARGLIERQHQNGNRKKVHIYLTQEGQSLKKILVPMAEEVNEIAVRDIPAKDVATTRRTLLAMIKNLAEDETH